MKFSILRMLILVSFLCIWLGFGAFSPVFLEFMKAETVYYTGIMRWTIGAFLTFLAAVFCLIALYAAGSVVERLQDPVGYLRGARREN
jgi:hypothetical protein